MPSTDDSYRYVQVEAAFGRVRALVQALCDVPAPGQVAVFGAQIGWPASEVRVLIRGGEAPTVDDDLLRPGGRRDELLHATARPVGTMSVPDTGVFAHRWFELRRDASVDAFVALSVAAWDAGFERLYDARPLGLFRADTAGATGERLLLITHYGSLADWSESRASATATTGQAAEVGRRLAERSALTERSWVCTSLRLA